MANWEQALENILNEWNEKHQKELEAKHTYQEGISRFLIDKAMPALEAFRQHLIKHDRVVDEIAPEFFEGGYQVCATSITVFYEGKVEFAQIISVDKGTVLMYPPKNSGISFPGDSGIGFMNQHTVDSIAQKLTERYRQVMLGH